MSEIEIPEFWTDEMAEKAIEVFRSGIRFGGEETQRFETELADFCHTKYGVSANSGTSALMMALAAREIGPGSEVIMGANDYVGVLAAVVRAGATPIFVDTENDTANIAADQVEQAITDRTRAIVASHMYGHPCNLGPLASLSQQHDLFLIEDVAHALGSEFNGKRSGSIGHVGFSSFSGKHITIYGPGGGAVTDDAGLAEDMASLRDQGRGRKKEISFIRRTDRTWYDQKFVGFNMHMTEACAALGRFQLRWLDGFIERRREIAAHYNERFTAAGLPIDLPPERDYAKHSYLHYTIQTDDRDGLRDHLENNGIPFNILYPSALHDLQPVIEQFGDQRGNFPNAEKLVKRILTLRVGPRMTDEGIEKTVETVTNYFKG
ncbi:MAG: DegT/DnrJ/EryC1/StrS family aminotransferase [Thermaerobacterales bacterium]